MKAAVLLSGGVDSATVLALLHRYGQAKLALGFDYGQPHKIELEYASRLAYDAGVPFELVHIARIGKTDDVVFAGRNAVLLSTAASIASSSGLDAIAIGSNLSDYQRFPDCRPGFIESMDSALSQAYGISVHAPVLRMAKSTVVRLARELGVNLDRTWSCYSPNTLSQPCGQCLACITRKEAGA